MALKELREEAGLSQRELGERLAKKLPRDGGEPKHYQPRISSYETNRNTMSLDVAMALVDILNKARKKKSLPPITVNELTAKRNKKPRG